MYRVSGSMSPAQVEALMTFFQREWWSQDRAIEDVRRMLDASSVVVAITDSTENLIGFARVVTDFAYVAFVLDVIVEPEKRGQGLGDELMRAVIDHPKLQQLRKGLSLKCRSDLRPFYERWGFETRVELPDDGGWEMVRPQGSGDRPA